MTEVSVVIPNHNGERFLKECLTSLGEQDGVDIEVIIVDNGSTDKSLDIVSKTCPGARIIRLDKNYGFSKAVNEGIRAAESPYVFLLNNDTRLEKGCIKELYEAIGRSKRIFSVSAKMLNMKDPGLIDSAGDLYCILGWAFARGKDKDSHGYAGRSDVFSACAGAAIYRKSVFDVIGYFDERHFAYLEDVDIGYRARICGYRNVYEPGALVYHAGSGMSGSRYNEFKISLASRNSVYLAYKNMPLFQLVINMPFLLAGFAVKAVFFARKGFGRTYVTGLLKGLLMCISGDKFPYKHDNFMNYFKIQLELWINTVKRFAD
ncbi:MAG: glycosyltransferase family 2 protein [Lachnospiraceae bacterium]|nr:glycosyltransferase family 2 protein [Lachnospiraceae bacterium]